MNCFIFSSERTTSLLKLIFDYWISFMSWINKEYLYKQYKIFICRKAIYSFFSCRSPNFLKLPFLLILYLNLCSFYLFLSGNFQVPYSHKQCFRFDSSHDALTIPDWDLRYWSMLTMILLQLILLCFHLNMGNCT